MPVPPAETDVKIRTERNVLVFVVFPAAAVHKSDNRIYTILPRSQTRHITRLLYACIVNKIEEQPKNVWIQRKLKVLRFLHSANDRQAHNLLHINSSRMIKTTSPVIVSGNGSR